MVNYVKRRKKVEYFYFIVRLETIFMKSINIKSLKSVNLCYENNLKFLILKKDGRTYKILLPNFIKLIKTNNFIYFKTEKNLIEIDNLYRKIINILESNKDVRYKKVLILKGLGFKASIEAINTLVLKIGYSHLIHLKIPKEINVNIQNSILLLESSEKIVLGNFASKIKKLKIPDNYKGKGFWTKYDNVLLKEIKKK